MRGSSLGYLFKEGARSIKANRLMSLASIGVLMACLTLIGWAVMISVNITEMVGYAQSQNEIVVFVDDDYDSDQVDTVENQLGNIEGIVKIEFQSKEDALQITKENLGEAGALLEGLEDGQNPIPDSFIVKASDNVDMNDVTDEIADIEGVIEVNAPLDAANTLTDVRNLVNYGGLFIISIMGVVSLVIIANTIKIAVYSRRKQINIMKYVGATDMFIRLPFIIEGIIIGFISALIAFLIVWGSYSYAISWVAQNPEILFGFAKETIVAFKDVAILLGAGFAGAGVVIGGFGSMIFVRKHLRV